MKSVKLILLIFFSLSVFYINACKKESLVEKGSPEYIDEINNWHKKRLERLTKKDSWLSLAGLYWLKQGKNTFGADKSNDIVFPEGKSADFMGTFFLDQKVVTVEVNEGVQVTTENKIVNKLVLAADISDKPTLLNYGSLTWFVIIRGEKIGIRLRDSENPAIKDFQGLERYPVNKDWKISAKWEAYEPPKLISIPTVLGTIDEDTSFGAVVFSHNNKEYKLDVTGKKEYLFIIFADQTNGDETYGTGRFISANRNIKTGEVLIDFNKSYNPPCAFTKYATCPLPPEQNQLKLKITAGEKFKEHTH